MNYYNDLPPFPALPRHLNPFSLYQPRIGRQDSFRRGPSPLRQSLILEDLCSNARSCSCNCIVEGDFESDEREICSAIVDCASVSSSASNNAPMPWTPPGLNSVNSRNSSHYRFPDNIQEALDSARTSAESALRCAARRKLTKTMKSLALEHTKICLEIIEIHAKRIESQLEQTSNLVKTNSDVSQKEALEVEVRTLKAQRRIIRDLLTC